MSNETETLAAFAAGLKYEDIPPEVVERTKDCIIDTIGAAIFGSSLPWSRIIIDYVKNNGAGGNCTVLGPDGIRTTPPMAALANGVMAHAFEMDSLRQPSAGIHPGSTLGPSGLAIAEELGASGRELITAFVAGNEVMSRIGLADRHSSEKLGFHAPGLTGPIGSALVAGRLMGLDAGRMTNAMGVAGSLCSGILEFVRSGTGGMVKRLHLGRASEGGVLAANLARDGFTGPTTVLEGEFGFLNVFCRDADLSQLTDGLGERFETLNLCLKRFPCHITAHTPVQAALDLKAEHGFNGAEVEAVLVRGSDKMVSHHNIPEPSDVMLAQYSTPFCVALAMLGDPLDPRSFSDDSLNDDAIRGLCRKVRVEKRLEEDGETTPWASVVEVTLKDGRRLKGRADSFKGMPSDPVSRTELAEKFNRLTRDMTAEWRHRLLDQLLNLEQLDRLTGLGPVAK
ncbi:MAG: MmgE/PrpD family protein, partial [Alphaproteobacteria bacterium]